MSLPRRLSLGLCALALTALSLLVLDAHPHMQRVNADHAGGVTYVGLITSPGELRVTGSISFDVSPDRSAVTAISVTLLVASENYRCEVLFSVGPTGDSLQYPGTFESTKTYLMLPLTIQARSDGRHEFTANSGTVEIDGMFRSAERAEGTIRFIRARVPGGGVVASGGPCGTPALPWTATAPLPPPPPAPTETAIPTPVPATATPTPEPTPGSTGVMPVPTAPAPVVLTGKTEHGEAVSITLNDERTMVTRFTVGDEAMTNPAPLATSPCGQSFARVVLDLSEMLTDGRLSVTRPDGEFELTLTGILDGDRMSGTLAWNLPSDSTCATPTIAWSAELSPARTE
jgi:hypothetical protein